MLFFSYWITNQRYALSGETALMRKLELVNGWFKPHIYPMADSVLLINVSYDPVLVGVHDSEGIPAGLDMITDRWKLLKLLQELKRNDDYKYIMMDVIFPDDNDLRTEADSLLYNQIRSMDRIVIPKDVNKRLADDRLNEKAGIANYYTNYQFVSFAKYPYLIGEERSMPLKMYEEITGRHIKDYGLFALDGYKLVRTSIMLPFELRCDSAYTQNGEKTWYNLGMDLLGCSYKFGNDSIQGNDELYSNPDLTRGKYIVIGAFSSGDMHYSYLENQPGSAILFNAFLALLHQHHVLSWGVFLLLFVAFFILSYLILGQKTLSVAIAGLDVGNNSVLKAGQKTLNVIVSWIGYSMFLTILCIITYIWMGEVYDVFFTATLFQLLSIVIKLIRKFKK